MSNEKIASHREPVWRDRADFLIHGEAPDGVLEQLWARRLGETTFEICCIPFFLFDVHLGDEVATASSGERAWTLQRVTRPSGRKTFRAWFGESRRPSCQAEVEAAAEALGCEVERSSESLLAFAADEDAVQPLADLLWGYEQRGELIYETGQSAP